MIGSVGVKNGSDGKREICGFLREQGNAQPAMRGGEGTGFCEHGRVYQGGTSQRTAGESEGERMSATILQKVHLEAFAEWLAEKGFEVRQETPEKIIIEVKEPKN